MGTSTCNLNLLTSSNRWQNGLVHVLSYERFCCNSGSLEGKERRGCRAASINGDEMLWYWGLIGDQVDLHLTLVSICTSSGPKIFRMEDLTRRDKR